MLATLVARDFRNLAPLELRLAPQGLAVVGDNGHGKTNLLEAIAYANLLRSIRGTRDVDVIRFGAPSCDLRAERGGDDARATITIGIDRATRTKRVRVDGVETRRLASALGTIPSVLVSPSDVALIAGGPAERRRYLDVLLALTDATYLHALTRYRAALERRNGALRRGAHADLDEVASWEPALAHHGGQLVAARARWVATWASRFAERCEALGEETPVALSYRTSIGETADITATHAREALAAALAARRAHDVRRALTHDGPHRDELVIVLGERELRAFGSSGQQRTAAIALRMCEAATWRGHLGHPPLFLLDDPFAELDAGRARRILESFEAAGLGQVVLVVPREVDIPEAFTRLDRARMQHGVLS
ncbi:MAG: DNA replication and repair protein RecF [Gemmatimonadaceae bacterium]|nr:DNA replication and repair protein RecF [Gemmatimonadaceae bacterium]